jgi:tripartite-type tricarboxylate transporter receptor subunit TctC
MVPAKTPVQVVARLQVETNQALATPDIRQKFLAQGLEPRGGTAADFEAFIAAETRKWSQVIRDAGIKGE